MASHHLHLTALRAAPYRHRIQPNLTMHDNQYHHWLTNNNLHRRCLTYVSKAKTVPRAQLRRARVTHLMPSPLSPTPQEKPSPTHSLDILMQDRLALAPSLGRPMAIRDRPCHACASLRGGGCAKTPDSLRCPHRFAHFTSTSSPLAAFVGWSTQRSLCVVGMA